MAVIEERKQEDGKTSYRARVRLKGYPPKSATFDRKTDATRWAQRVEADMRSGRYFPDTHAKKHTVTDLIEIYLDDLEGRNPKRYRDVKRLLQWWKDEIGYLMLSDFNSEHALKGQQKLCKQERKRKGRNGEPVLLSPAYVNRHTVALHTAIDFGVKKLKWISHNPVSDIDKMKEPKGRTRFLSEDEIDRLVEACKSSENPFLLTIVLLGISTGARRGEIEEMKWVDVDKNVTQIILPDTKNGEIRTVPLAGVVQALIIKLKDKKVENDVFLFPSPNNPKKSIDFRHAWEFALAKAGIENFRFHDLRHSCASYLAMNGANAIEMADTLGHKTLSMVRRYAHLSPNHVSSVVEKMTKKVLGHVEI